ncbi:type II toxin-antitoxin system HicB family antitoxin [Photorhabdus africana]|uniref:type II toxin-antitoxin system HicB family antitoxin n=1 Tax=Photorhabdus africana TaxID=3097554 RepID=UPI002B40803A|nr:type II toxin-antitoxin system HicB family antitoxin [Photorhabdus sp. CRI-LC]
MDVLTEQGGYVPNNSSDYIGAPRLSGNGEVITLIELDPEKYESKVIKFNLTILGNLLTAIDRYIEENNHHKNRSAFLAELTRKEMAHH